MITEVKAESLENTVKTCFFELDILSDTKVKHVVQHNNGLNLNLINTL
jgi:hypothetical protein